MAGVDTDDNENKHVTTIIEGYLDHCWIYSPSSLVVQFCIISSHFLSLLAGNMSGNMFHNAYISWSCAPLLVFSILLLRRGRRLTVVFGFFAIFLMSITMAVLTSLQNLEGGYWNITDYSCKLSMMMISFSSYYYQQYCVSAKASRILKFINWITFRTYRLNRHFIYFQA